MTKKLGSEIDTNKGFAKSDIKSRTKILSDYCLERWWSDRAADTPKTTMVIEDEIETINE